MWISLASTTEHWCIFTIHINAAWCDNVRDSVKLHYLQIFYRELSDRTCRIKSGGRKGSTATPFSLAGEIVIFCSFKFLKIRVLRPLGTEDVVLTGLSLVGKFGANAL